jgi:xanthine/CO dehydrogenase XdhC/CoxF family maturation factor
MKEFEEILGFLSGAVPAAPLVLATLVHVQGSTYRRPGARMLIQHGKRLLGTISGGCLEADVCRQSVDLKSARVVQFNTLDDDDVLLGYSMGCKGVIQILLQPVGPNLPSPLDHVAQCLQRGETAALATVYSGPFTGAQALLHNDGLAGNVDPALVERVRDDLRDVLATGRWRNRAYELASGRADVFIEPLLPPVRLTIFGGGFDAPPLAQIASAMGWRVSVVDPRPRDAIAARFPTAHPIIESSPRAAARELAFDARSAAVLMTHNYAHDLDLLAGLLPRRLPYVGLLGPRHRTERLMHDLAEQHGIRPTPEQLNSLFTPAGLDIGTNAPEEIALAIAAEIQSVLSRRAGGHLRDRAGDIHDSIS